MARQKMVEEAPALPPVDTETPPESGITPDALYPWLLAGIWGAIGEMRPAAQTYYDSSLVSVAAQVCEWVESGDADLWRPRVMQLIEQYSEPVDVRVLWYSTLPTPRQIAEGLQPVRVGTQLLYAPMDLDAGHAVRVSEGGAITVAVIAKRHVYPRPTRRKAGE